LCKSSPGGSLGFVEGKIILEGLYDVVEPIKFLNLHILQIDMHSVVIALLRLGDGTLLYF